MIAAAYQRTVTLLAGELKRGLKEVHVQPGALVKTPERGGSVQPAQPPANILGSSLRFSIFSTRCGTNEQITPALR